MLEYVYPVRPGRNEELRYSLRSLKNAPAGRVWVAGSKPPWVTNVEFIPGNAHNDGQKNMLYNILAVLRHPDCGENVIIMNDDFYILKQVSAIPIQFRKTLRQHIDGLRRVSWWSHSLRATHSVLLNEGHELPISWELHQPFPADRDKMITAVQDCLLHSPTLQFRSIYGNRYLKPIMSNTDGKFSSKNQDWDRTFVSSHDFMFPLMKSKLEKLFPEKSIYEND